MNTPPESRALIVGTPDLLSAVVLNADTQLLVDDALSRAAAIVAVPWDDPETFTAHREVGDTLGALKTTIDKARLEASRPHRALTDAINDAGNAVLATVTRAHQRLGAMLKAAADKAEAERQRLIAEQRRRDEEVAAERERIRAAEQKRIDDAHAEEVRHAKALHDAQVAAALAQQQAAADGDDAMPMEPVVVPVFVEPPAPPVFVAPDPVREVVATSIFIPDKMSSGVRTTAAKYEVQVIDPALVPDSFGGVDLWMIDPKACKVLGDLLHKQKKPMPPGLKYVQVSGPGIASTGRG